MKVNELIKQLQTYNPDDEVFFEYVHPIYDTEIYCLNVDITPCYSKYSPYLVISPIIDSAVDEIGEYLVLRADE